MSMAITVAKHDRLNDTRAWLDQQSMVLACPYIYPPVSRYEPLRASEIFAEGAFADPVAVYLHVPFCSYRCEFCNFALDVLSEASAPVDAYLAKLRDELAHASRIAGNPVRATSIHVGGGTPTIMNSRQIGLFLDMLDTYVDRSALRELCFEATPDSVGRAPRKIAQLADFGVNRISLGVQSFQQDELTKMKRMHSAGDVFRAYEVLRAQSAARVNVDLMFGFPAQTVASFERDIQTAVDLGVDSITLYELRIPPRSHDLTLGASTRLSATEFALQAQDLLARLSYLRSSPNQYVRSEEAYQGHYVDVREELRPLAGFGVSALGFASGVSYKGAATLKDYMATSDFDAHYRGCALSFQDQVNRAAILGIRSPRGLNCVVFEATFGSGFRTVFSTFVDELLARGLAEFSGRHFRLSDTGALFVDQIAVLFYGSIDRESVMTHEHKHLGVYWH